MPNIYKKAHGYKLLSFSVKVNGYFPHVLNMQCDFYQRMDLFISHKA